MIYSPLCHKAIEFAARVHQGQTRKGKSTPYIVHALAVGLIIARVSKDENMIAAGILHDTIEDCKPYGSITRDLLAKEFNPQVADIVNDLTEPSFAKGFGRAQQDKKTTWLERKLAALQHIKHMKKDSLLVKSADVLHNLTELNEDLKLDGDKVFAKFNASKADTITRYDKLIPELERVWPENPLIKDLLSAHSQFHQLLNNP